MINIGLYAQTTKFRKQGDAFHAAGVRGHVDLAFELVGKKTFMEILQQTPRSKRLGGRHSSAGSALSCGREIAGSKLRSASKTKVSELALCIPFDGI